MSVRAEDTITLGLSPGSAQSDAKDFGVQVSGATLDLSAEQVYRLLALRRGPAGSVLAVVARPFVSRLLA